MTTDNRQNGRKIEKKIFGEHTPTHEDSSNNINNKKSFCCNRCCCYQQYIFFLLVPVYSSATLHVRLLVCCVVLYLSEIDVHRMISTFFYFCSLCLSALEEPRNKTHIIYQYHNIQSNKPCKAKGSHRLNNRRKSEF